MSESLRLLPKNEGITRFLSELHIRSFFWQKTSDLLRKLMSKFPALNKCLFKGERKKYFFKGERKKYFFKGKRKKYFLKGERKTFLFKGERTSRVRGKNYFLKVKGKILLQR